jgi:DNA-binding CsgD family transcriptional regulator
LVINIEEELFERGAAKTIGRFRGKAAPSRNTGGNVLGGMGESSGDRREDRSRSTGSGASVVACVEVDAAADKGAKSVHPSVLWGLAVRRLERCLRPSDWMCPVGTGRVAVCFGGGADQVPPSMLGARLARAIGDHLAVGASDLDLHVTVGVGTCAAPGDDTTLVCAALSAVAADRRRCRVRPSSGAPARPRVLGADVRSPAHSAGGVSLVRRMVETLGPDVVRVGFDGARTSRRPASRSAKSELSVLVVGPARSIRGRPSPAVEGVTAVMRDHGIEPTVVGPCDPIEAIARYRELEPDVVIIPLRSPAPLELSRQTTPWEPWALVCRALVQAGASVQAVGVGASVAAISACVREGADGVLDLWEFRERLEKLEADLPTRRLNSGENGHAEVRWSNARPSLPHPYDALVELTISEHRVLYHMMRGAAASEIADCLIVSLATVRSHIRSILRKLGVSSQLAAVALANGAYPEYIDAI